MAAVEEEKVAGLERVEYVGADLLNWRVVDLVRYRRDFRSRRGVDADEARVQAVESN